MASQPPMQQFPPQAPYPYLPPANPIAGPTKVFGIIHAVLAVLSVMGALSLGAIGTLAGVQHEMGAGILFTAITIFVLVSAALQGTTAYGLLARKSWGRVLLIVTSILSLISIPIGTVLGGLALYFFMRGSAEQDYARLVRGDAQGF